jgi:hypothetical protein
MYFRLIVIIALFTTCTHLLADKQSDDAEKQLQNKLKIEKFKTISGFEGSIQTIDDNRLFFKMQGSFPLPEPVDTVIFRSNIETIAGYIKSMYEIIDSTFVLKQHPTRQIEVYNSPGQPIEQKYAATYLQYYYGFWLSLYRSSISVEIPPYGNIEGTLEIRYSLTKKQYIITNRLLLEDIPLPKPRISKEQALETVRVQHQILLDMTSALHAPPKRNFSLKLLDHYISIVTSNDQKTRTFKYIYLINSADVNETQRYLVDGITGEMSKPEIIN